MVLVEIGNFHEHFGCAQAVSVRLAQKGMCQLILMLFSGIDGTGQIKFINKSVFVVDPVKKAVFFTGKLSGKADRPALSFGTGTAEPDLMNMGLDLFIRLFRDTIFPLVMSACILERRFHSLFDLFYHIRSEISELVDRIDRDPEQTVFALLLVGKCPRPRIVFEKIGVSKEIKLAAAGYEAEYRQPFYIQGHDGVAVAQDPPVCLLHGKDG